MSDEKKVAVGSRQSSFAEATEDEKSRRQKLGGDLIV